MVCILKIKEGNPPVSPKFQLGSIVLNPSPNKAKAGFKKLPSKSKWIFDNYSYLGTGLSIMHPL